MNESTTTMPYASLLQKADQLFRLKMYQEAYNQYLHILSLQPLHASAMSKAGLCLLRGTGQPDTALAYLKMAVVICPDDIDLLTLYALIAAEVGKFDIALNALRAATMLAPNNADVHVHLSKIYLSNDQPLSAYCHAQIALQLEPGNLETKEIAEKSRAILLKTGMRVEDGIIHLDVKFFWGNMKIRESLEVLWLKESREVA